MRRMARWMAGVVLALACGVAEGAFMEFGGDPVDYVKIRLWKEDGELKSEFRGVETEFGEIAADFGRIAGRGHADWPVHWLVGREVTVGELSAKVGALAALGFTNQFFLATGETAAQHLEFDLAGFAVWDGAELEEEEWWGKAEEVVFPRVEFNRAAVADVMEWMEYAAEATGMGVRVEPKDALTGVPPLTMKTGGTVREIVEAVGAAWGCRVELEEDGSGWVFMREEDGTAAARQDGDGGGRAGGPILGGGG